MHVENDCRNSALKRNRRLKKTHVATQRYSDSLLCYDDAMIDGRNFTNRLLTFTNFFSISFSLLPFLRFLSFYIFIIFSMFLSLFSSFYVYSIFSIGCIILPLSLFQSFSYGSFTYSSLLVFFFHCHIVPIYF